MSQNNYWPTTLFTSWAVLLLALASTGQAQMIKIEGQTMGPIGYKVLIDSFPKEADRQAVAETIQSELDSVNQLMSTYISDSDVSRFNNSTDTDWFPVSSDTAKVIQRALRISQQTGGAFDITVGPLVELWHFGPEKDSREIPSDQVISEARERVGFSKIGARLEPPALKKSIGNIRIDLSAIAKGYAVDRVANRLDEQGFESFMVIVGGDGRTRGLKSDGSKWPIGIERPDSEKAGVYDSIAPLESSALATSGDYRNFFTVDGVNYSHTIDPETGRPVTHKLASASVIADDCMTADAFATAALVLGKQKAVELLDELGMKYHLISREQTGFSKTTSDGLELIDVPGTAKGSQLIPMFIGAAVIFGLAILGMAVGAIVNNKPITGSCGGLSAQTGEDGDTSCSLCHKPVAECPDVESNKV